MFSVGSVRSISDDCGRYHVSLLAFGSAWAEAVVVADTPAHAASFALARAAQQLDADSLLSLPAGRCG